MIKNKIFKSFKSLILILLITSFLVLTSCSETIDEPREIIESVPSEDTEVDQITSNVSQELIEEEPIPFEEENIIELEEIEEIEEELTYTTKEISGCELEFEYSSDWYVEVDKTPGEGIFFKAYYLNSSDLFVEVGQFYNTEDLYVGQIEDEMNAAANRDSTISNFRISSDFELVGERWSQVHTAKYNKNLSDKNYYCMEKIYSWGKVCDFTYTVNADKKSQLWYEVSKIQSSIKSN